MGDAESDESPVRVRLAIARIDSLNGARKTPRSVMMAVIFFAGVTSKAGFSIRTPCGVTCDPCTWVTSRAARCSIGIRSPEAVARSIVLNGAAT